MLLLMAGGFEGNPDIVLRPTLGEALDPLLCEGLEPFGKRFCLVGLKKPKIFMVIKKINLE